MARPEHLTAVNTRFFADTGDIKEAEEVKSLMGFIDGVTTNPTLVKRNSEIAAKLERGETLTLDELESTYHNIALALSSLNPDGSVSLEVYADTSTTADEMFDQGQEMDAWITNAHIKYPLTKAGLAAAQRSVLVLVNVNITLNFTSDQAAAVFSATQGATRGQVFISPFVGRLDDIRIDGMSLVEEVMDVRDRSGSQAEVLVASVRNVNHLMRAIQLGADITTSPVGVLREWVEMGMPLPDENFVYNPTELTRIQHRVIPVNRPWRKYDISHPLTDKGQQGFADNWNEMLGQRR